MNSKKILIFMFALLFGGCFPASKLPYTFGYYPKDVFVQSGQNKNIYSEQNTSDFTNKVTYEYLDAKTTIEKTQGGVFKKEPDVYICNTQDCYNKYAVVTTASAETQPFGNSIILNGLKLQENNTTKAILTHELSHAYWFSYGVRCQPRWWEEGMAVYASGGGGAEKCSIGEATQAAIKGNVFYPSDESGCFVFFSTMSVAEKYHITWPMFYRQSGMFVEFLHNKNNQAFENMLTILKDKKDINIAIQLSYNKDVQTLWAEWLDSLKN